MKNKHRQYKKMGNFSLLSRKSGQEEMVGFALIMIIVAVILLIFLSFSLGKSEKETVESYEVESFIQSMLQYTTDCRDNLEYLPVQKLIFDCYDKKKCIDKRDTCEVLNSTLKEIVKESWKIEGDRPVKGYGLEIIVEGEKRIIIKEGNVTGNSKGSTTPFSNYEIFFNVYY
ncbi:MAG: hypothetical protein WCX73_03205 [Candidatus Pacearchaeota archaeon]|jgi:hypothetical protein